MNAGEIYVTYNDLSNWRKINANPISFRQAISTLYAIAPFYRARVEFPGNYGGHFAIYEYKNGRVRKYL